MPIFVMCVGVPGSGKSTHCEEYLNHYYDADYLSSDVIRTILYNDVNDQKHNRAVFKVMNARAKQMLELGVNVVYDATNLSRQRRTLLLDGLPPCEKICYWFDTPVDECIRRDAVRERHVGTEVINRMNCQLEVPTYDEGWDKIIIIRRDEDV